jgi:hypothetical protein
MLLGIDEGIADDDNYDMLGEMVLSTGHGVGTKGATLGAGNVIGTSNLGTTFFFFKKKKNGRGVEE